METNSRAELKAAKIRRSELTTAVSEARDIAAAKAAIWDLTEARVRDVKKRRGAKVAANKPTEVRRISDELMDAEAERECAEAEAVASKLLFDEQIKALKVAEAAVNAAAQACLDAASIELAAEFEAAMDRAIELGEQLQALTLRDGFNTPVNQLAQPLALPVEVQRALEKMPRPNPLHMRIDQIRAGNGSLARGERAHMLAELIR